MGRNERIFLNYRFISFKIYLSSKLVPQVKNIPVFLPSFAIKFKANRFLSYDRTF